MLIYSQFNTAFQYYEKLIRSYEDTYFNKHEEIDIEEMSKYAYFGYFYSR